MRRTVWIAPALAAVLLLGGCSAAVDESAGFGGSDSGGAPGVAAPDVASESDGGDGTTAVDRSVVITGYLTVTVDDPADAAREATRIVETAGGRIDGRQEYAPSEFSGGSAVLELRIPADTLTRTLDELRELGRVDEVQLGSVDVTVEVQDLDARIESARASVERIRALLARAESIDDLISLESALSQRQAELESYEAQRRYYAEQVSLSTITLELRSEAEAPQSVPGDFVEGLGAGWGAFVAFWSGFVIVLGILAPWLIFAGLVTVGVIALVKWRRRRAG